jgi:hypothetical protein
MARLVDVAYFTTKDLDELVVPEGLQQQLREAGLDADKPWSDSDEDKRYALFVDYAPEQACHVEKALAGHYTVVAGSTKPWCTCGGTEVRFKPKTVIELAHELKDVPPEQFAQAFHRAVQDELSALRANDLDTWGNSGIVANGRYDSMWFTLRQALLGEL